MNREPIEKDDTEESNHNTLLSNKERSLLNERPISCPPEFVFDTVQNNLHEFKNYRDQDTGKPQEIHKTDSPDKYVNMQYSLEQVEEEQAEHIHEEKEVSALSQIQRDFPMSQSPIFEDEAKKQLATKENNKKQNKDEQQNFSFSEENIFDEENNSVSIEHHLERTNMGERPDPTVLKNTMQRGGGQMPNNMNLNQMQMNPNQMNPMMQLQAMMGNNNMMSNTMGKQMTPYEMNMMTMQMMGMPYNNLNFNMMPMGYDQMGNPMQPNMPDNNKRDDFHGHDFRDQRETKDARERRQYDNYKKDPPMKIPMDNPWENSGGGGVFIQGGGGQQQRGGGGGQGGGGGGQQHGDRGEHRQRGNKKGPSNNSGNMANKDGYKDRKHYKSQLLEDFRSRNRKIEFSELRDHIVEFSQDQHGSRFIQQKFETASVDEKNLIFEEIMPHALELIVDVFGNQVIQRLLEHGDTNQRKVLGEKIKGHVLEFSLQMYGCRVIQKAVEVVEYTQKFLLASELSHNVIRCVEDQNGNHVIQKIIEFVGKNDEHINLVVNAFRGRSQEMAVHPQGCRVMQRMLEHCSQRVMTPIIEEIIPYVIALSEDQQGNYAIQHILQFGSDQQVAYVYKQVAGKILQMSMHKQASNVIEKTLVFGKAFQKKGILDEIVWDDEMNTTLVTMMKDMYANQVIQKSIELAEGEQLNVILRCVKEQAPNLRKFTQGRHIVGYVEKMMFTNKI